MANCGITNGMGVSCDNLRKPAGLSKRVWVANLDAFRLPIPVQLNTYITDFEMNVYKGLYKFESTKFAHQGTWTIQKGDGGNVSFQHQVVMRLFNSEPVSDEVLEDLTTADVVVIVETNNQELLIYGGGNGLNATEGTGTTGRQLTDDTATVITLTGVEKYIPKRFLRVDYATSIAYLNALSV